MESMQRAEYPRPQFVRDNWMCLNGEWDFKFDFSVTGEERGFYSLEGFYTGEYRKITVPFCPESRLSGIGYTDFIPAVWYMRSVNINADRLRGKKTLLHFGAVDYRCRVWINGELAGEHKGGYSSFAFDITKLIHEEENTIAVYALDDQRSGRQPCGKQSDRFASHDCSYTRTTGIWQTVWLEFVPEIYIKSCHIIPDTENCSALISAEVCASDGTKVCFDVTYKGENAGHAVAAVKCGTATAEVKLSFLRLWDVGQPELYDLEITAGEDRVSSYFGMRSVDIRPDALYLNGRPLFMRTVLDQGFNPDGIYTAPSDEFLRRDIELSMAAGFNGARLHQRVFEERTLYWADKLGYIVWGEYANGNITSDGSGIAYFLPEWMETVKRDYNHPSIIGWCPDNESYWEHNVDGIFQRTVYSVTKAIDPTRPVIDASGGLHFVTDMFDVHEYEQDPETLRQKLEPMLSDPEAFHNPLHNKVLERHHYEGQPYWISEYGGTFWNSERTEDGGWGYGQNPVSEEDFAARYEGLTRTLLECPRVCGFCYTQLTDIEQEQNGLYKYDRSPKFSPETYARIKAANTGRAAVETPAD